jgi:hypothetical protein
MKFIRALMITTLISTPALAADDVQIKRLFEYVQSLDERITKLEAQLKNAGASTVTSGAKIALGGWTDQNAWRGIKKYSTHEREVLARLGEPTLREKIGYSSKVRWIYEGTVNGSYVMGYVEIFQGKVSDFKAP